jgi:hypothetical protein
MSETTPSTTGTATFGQSLGGQTLFTVQPGIAVQDALQHASLLLNSASTLFAETSDADASTCRAMNWAIQQLVDMSRGLIEASLTGMQPEVK